MRVLQVAPPWLNVPPEGYGGTEMVIAELSEALDKDGISVELFATGASSSVYRAGWVYPEALGMQSFRPAAEIYQALSARDVALREEVDLLHDHTMAGAVLPVDLPTVFTQHNRFTEESRPLYQRAQEHGAAVVAISRSHAGEAGFPVRRVIHHGIELSRYRYGDGEGGYLLFLGRMSPDKGVHHAVKIAHEVGIPLRIAAKMKEASEIEYFRKQVEPDLGSEDQFIGQVTFDEKVALLGSALAMVNPIQWAEPFGMTAIESMACGTPVLTTNFGAAPEVVMEAHTGFVRPLAELSATVELLGKIDRNACRQHVEAHFSSERMAREYIDLYRELI